MKDLYTSGNYIIFDDGAGDAREYAKNAVVYEETATAFSIQDTLGNQETLSILKSEITAGDWQDDNPTVYTEATMRTFLRDNTGFNTVGSLQDVSDVPAYSTGNAGDLLAQNGTQDGTEWVAPPSGAKVLLGHLTQSGTGDPVLTILKNTTGFTFTGTRLAVATYGILTVENGNVADFWAILSSNDDSVIRWTGNTDNFGRVQIDFKKHMLDGAANADGLNHVSFHVEFLG